MILLIALQIAASFRPEARSAGAPESRGAAPRVGFRSVEPGLLASGFLIGLTEVDAVVLAVTRPGAAIDVPLAVRVLVVAVVANSVFKAGVSLVVGRASFRWLAFVGLVAMALALLLPAAFLT